MSDSERTPLINGGNGNRTRELLHDPPWLDSYKFFVFGSWFNVLLFFIPLSFLSHFLNWDAALRFSFSFFAIIPLAKVRWLCAFSSRARSAYSPRSSCSQLLGDATDQLSVRLGQTLSGLLNASFGNAVEIIVGVARTFARRTPDRADLGECGTFTAYWSEKFNCPFRCWDQSSRTSY